MDLAAGAASVWVLMELMGGQTRVAVSPASLGPV